ncbi:unnamed protein product [Chilo suppressalis]|uniref:Endonuclease/exonuclease/phosphatase domain-containing protein n=1 Tax=Chilo suppressalis TaxID=168631 RepID=A0ABN8ATD5_CHISP|nr:unnamed protein product [Chilo suppressalis]
MDFDITKPIYPNCTNINSFTKQISKNVHLLCLHINIRSLIKNFTKLLQIIDSSTHPLDVIAVSEVGISDSISSLFHIPDYAMYSQLRNNRKGGGIILYVKKYLYPKKNSNTYF